MSKSKKCASVNGCMLRCKCIRITDNATGKIEATYYAVGGKLYGFIEGMRKLPYSTTEFMWRFSSRKGTAQSARRLYGKGYKVQVFMYDQALSL